MKEGNGLHSGGEKVWGRNPFESAENFGKEDDEKEAGSEIQREAGHDLPVSSGPRPRLAPTIAVYLAFFACGIGSSILGPTIISMEIVLDTTTKVIALAFTSSAVGLLIGAAICGISYDRVNKELFFLVSGFLLSAALATAPFFPHVYGFIGIMALKDVCSGLILSGGQSYLLRVWQLSRFRESAMQALHGFWSFGATTGPFIASLFLVPLPDQHDVTANATYTSYLSGDNGSSPTMAAPREAVSSASKLLNNVLTSAAARLLKSTSEPATVYTQGSSNTEADVGVVRFAYLAITGIVIIAPIVFTAVFISKGPTCKPNWHENKNKNSGNGTCNENAPNENATQQSASPRCFRVTLTILLLCLSFLFCLAEAITCHLMASYVVKGLGWPNSHGALATSVYFGAHTTARVLGIVSSAFIPAEYLIIVDNTLILAGYVMMVFAKFHDIVTWIAAGVLGFGQGTCAPCLILLTSHHFAISGRISALFIVVTAVASITGPWSVTFLMEELHPDSFVYSGLTCSLLACVVLVGTRLYIRKYTGKTPAPKLEDKTGGHTEEVTPEVIPLKTVGNFA